jgi:SpoIIAA-like
MAIELTEKDGGKILEVSLTGKLVKQDYNTFVPAVDRALEQHGKIRMLVLMHDFHGWTASAAWEDTKFGVRHFCDIDRLAMVGETRWQHGMAIFCKPFTTATVRYFEHNQVDAARAWLAARED